MIQPASISNNVRSFAQTLSNAFSTGDDPETCRLPKEDAEIRCALERKDIPRAAHLVHQALQPNDKSSNALRQYGPEWQTYPSFAEEYLSKLSNHHRGKFITEIAAHICDDLKKQVTVKDNPPAGWLAYRGKLYFHLYLPVWMRPDLYRDVEQVLKDGRDSLIHTSFAHGTSSAALEGIGRQKGLYAGASISELQSGEATFDFDEKTDRYVFARNTDVWASRNFGIAKGYCKPRWPDEYPVVIGIDRNASCKGLSYEGDWFKSPVPLSLFTYVAAPKVREEQARAWLKKYAPHAVFIPLEYYNY